jgi:diguanylate cyclase (GGDEF)-like protein
MTLLRTLVFPGGVVLATAIAAHRWAPRDVTSLVAPFLQYVLVAIGLVLAWNYNRSRIFMLLLLIGLAACFLPVLHALDGEMHFRAQLVCVLIPLNAALLVLWKDRAMLAPAGLVALGIIGVQGMLIAMLPMARQTYWGGLLAEVLAQRAWSARPWMGQIGVLTFAGMMTALLAISFLRRTPIERGMFWGLTAVFAACVSVQDRATSSLFFSAAAMVAGISILEHAHAIAYRDELTGLPSRRALNEFLPRLSGTFSIAMVDVDHFKQFNDTYGHDVGDEVLRMVASKLGRLQETGRVYRYGGEEFIVLFPDFTKDQANPFLESLRATIENTIFRVRGPQRRKSKAESKAGLRPRGGDRRIRKSRGFSRTVEESVTVSIGLAERSEAWSTPEQVIIAADKALYQAKRAGRNRVAGI